MPLVAGVDSSTQFTRIEIRDADTGELTTVAQVPHPAGPPPAGSPVVPEQDPAVWWRTFEEAWDQVGAPDVAAISVAAQPQGCVVLDDRFHPIRPAKLWRDTTTEPDAGWLRQQLPGGAAAWAQACGSAPVAALTITKLSWLHRSEPGTWAALRHVCLPHDWLTLQLTGELVTDRGDASGTGWWSPGDGRYRLDLLSIVDGDLDWSTMLPRVLDPVEPAGSWRAAVVAAGTGDHMAAALGLGLGPGDVMVSLGASGTVATVSDSPTADPSGRVSGFADAAGRHLPLVRTPSTTEVAEETEVGEETVCALLDGLDVLAEHARVDDGRIWLAGERVRSISLRQLLADLSERPVITSEDPEVVATGACIQAAATLAAVDPAVVHEAWGLRTGVTEPAGSVGGVPAAEVRGRYAELRDGSA